MNNKLPRPIDLVEIDLQLAGLHAERVGPLNQVSFNNFSVDLLYNQHSIQYYFLLIWHDQNHTIEYRVVEQIVQQHFPNANGHTFNIGFCENLWNTHRTSIENSKLPEYNMMKSYVIQLYPPLIK